ncbi:MAG: GMC family oxidoreductase N-terminal domain-containing protein [Devosia sp.]|nr:GMC family oxidoreductase N-terminal domain-containing protein [Devosia sp.]
MRRHPDVIVIGGGSAGSVIASQLAKDPSRSVLLLESGDRPLPIIHTFPIMAGVLSQHAWNMWKDQTEAEPALAGRRITWPHGRVLGGSSSINGMVWIRGRPSDYDRWEQCGADGWGWENVRPVFDLLDGGCGEADGFVPTQMHPGTNPLYDAFIEAGIEAGHPRSPDFNVAPYEGVGRYRLNILNGRRISAAAAFLRRKRQNLQIITNCTVLELIQERAQVVGVKASIKGRAHTFLAGETVLSAGAINSPKLLMLSGIGPAPMMEAAGIEVSHHLPGVGQNLQDHICGRITHECLQPVTLKNLTRVDRALVSGLENLFLGRGEASASPFGAGVVLRSDPTQIEPDVQGFLIPGLSNYRLWFPGIRPAASGHAFLASVYQLRPESRGSITLRSADPLAPPVIRPNYLSAPKDRIVLQNGMKRMAEILRQSPMAPFLGNKLSLTDPFDDQNFAAQLGKEAATAFHAVGTCRMGRAGDEAAVVGPDLKLHGLEGLRVADASVMPTLVSGNTNAATMMVGLRCSQFMGLQVGP